MDPEDTDTARAGDADREAVAERLRVAAGDGRIDLSELDERLGQAYAAKTYGQLEALVADLPIRRAGIARHDEQPEPDTLVIKTTKDNVRQSGPWVVPRRIVADTTRPFVTIDFREATCAHREVSVEAVTRTGWIRLIIPEGWGARISPLSTNTSHITSKAPETAEPGNPTIIVTGHPGSGRVKIRQRRRKQ